MNRLKTARLWLVGSVLFFPASAFAQFYPGFSDFDARAPERSFASSMMWQNRIKEHLLSAIIGVLVGVFFSNRFKKIRVWVFFGGLALLLLVGSLLSSTIGDVASFLVGLVAALLLLRDRAKAKAKAEKPPKPTTFGSAEWATLEHLKQHGLIGTKGFLLGVFEENGQRSPIHYTGDRHLLTVAPTRSGKGVASIIPNLLTYTGSAIVIDPKGENARITAARRGHGAKNLGIEGLGQRVHVVDPWGITGLRNVSCFNPMDWLKPSDEDISENAVMLADSIITPSKGAVDPFWDEEAKALLMGFLLYVALDDREKEDRTLGRVRDIISMGYDALKEILLQMVESPNPIVCSTAERTMSKDEKLRSGVLAVLQSHTHFLDSPRIRASLKRSDFRFEDLKTSKMTVYLVLPADRLETFGRWLRLMVQHAITVNARNIETKPDQPILFLLDEMAALGRLTMVEQAFGLMAGFGMQLWGIVQDLSQLERIYEKGWETFIGNSGVLQYFGSRDHKTADYFSKLCGVTTIQKFSLTRALAQAVGWSSSSTGGGQGGGSSTSGSSSSTTWSDSTTADYVQRHLAFPDELMVLRENRQLVLVENFNPIAGKKILWHKETYLRALGINLHAPLAGPTPTPGPVSASPPQEAPSAPKPTSPPSPSPADKPTRLVVAAPTMRKPVHGAAFKPRRKPSQGPKE